MTDAEIIDALQRGETLNYGCNGRNAAVMDLISGLEQRGLVETWDVSLEQETRRAVRWIEQPSA